MARHQDFTASGPFLDFMTPAQLDSSGAVPDLKVLQPSLSNGDDKVAVGWEGDQRGLSCQVIRSVQGFDEIRSDWQGMATNPTVDPDFCALLAITRPEIVRPHVLAVRQGGRVVGILAGRIEFANVSFRVGYKRVYRLRARCLTIPYGGLLGAESKDVVRFILAEILNEVHAVEFELVDFGFVRRCSLLSATVSEMAPWHRRALFQSAQIHRTMALPGSAAEIEKGMSKKHRYWVRRMRKQLQERFGNEVEFSCVQSVSSTGLLADELERVASHTYQRALGAGFVDNEEHRRRLGLWMQRGLLRAYFLRVQGKPVAFCLGTRFGETFFLSDMAFLPEMSVLEPGTLVFLHMLDCLCREGVKSLDFGLGDAFYKQRFGTESWEETMICLFAPGFKGLLLNATDTASRLISHAGRSLIGRLDSLKKYKKKWRQQLARASSSENKDTASSSD
jgi:CelD/BcsL family acetyltransferase involved in cellulose biosynthesis